MKTSVEFKYGDDYPCLKRYTDTSYDFVVLFTSPRSGVVVHVFKRRSTEERKIGDYAINWAEIDFVPFFGKVILEN